MLASHKDIPLIPNLVNDCRPAATHRANLPEFVIPAKGLVEKVEIASSLAPKGQAPRNDTKVVFHVIASDLKNRVAISKRCSWTFSTDPKAGIQVLYEYYMQFFRQFLTVIGIIFCARYPQKLVFSNI
ncbi:MAG: hypothetical protein WAV28_03480 [Sedimentisphaerales bacterium]